MCPAPNSKGGCLNRAPGYYVGLSCTPFVTSGDPSTCQSSNIGGGLKLAGEQFANARQDSFWVVIALIGGPANATSDINGSNNGNGFCPGSLGNPTWNWGGNGSGYCRFRDSTPYNPLTDRHWTTIDNTIPGSPVIVYPANYDPDDYARDMADKIAAPNPKGQGATIFAICMGSYCQNYPSPDPYSAEHLGQYMALQAGDDPSASPPITANHGLYFYAENPDQLSGVFAKILDNIIDSTAIVVTNTNDAGAGSLRQAILDVDAGGTITFAPSLAGQAITLQSVLSLEKSIVIDGSSLSSHIKINGNNAFSAFIIPEFLDLSITIKGLDIENSGDSSIFQRSSNLIISDVNFSNNHGLAYGGAIFVDSGLLNVSGSSFVGNLAYTGGGAIGNKGEMTVTASVFDTNGSGGDGGAIYNESKMDVSDSTFTGNNADEGGAIYTTPGTTGAYGSIIQSTVSNNSAWAGGGIANYGMLTITNSSISGNSTVSYYGAGGILNNGDGTLTVENSTISNNSAPSGGGILNLSPTGTVNISNSTISGNSATGANGYGGGISNSGGTLTATNVTLFGNSAAYGGGIINFGTSTITNSTISGNTSENPVISSGGIFNAGTLNYANTIIANSTGGGDCLNDEQYGVINTNIHNLVEDGSCSASLSGDPNLGPLADNGGPTYTMALLPASPAINAGDNDTCEATDQRGISRPQGAQCDIGAFEYIGDNPVVLSIIRKNTSPTPAVSVDFTVTFSESVTGLDMTGPDFDDFALTSTGVTGAAVSGVSGSGSDLHGHSQHRQRQRHHPPGCAGHRNHHRPGWEPSQWVTLHHRRNLYDQQECRCLHWRKPGWILSACPRSKHKKELCRCR